MKVILCLALFISLSLAAVVTTRSITLDELVKIRCSLNVEEETFFFFNGTMVAYLPTGNTFPLFNTIGINVGRCFKNTDGTYTLASRELLYYLDFRTGAIIDTWNNPWTGRANLTVAHVDNDPVLQQFSASMVSRAKLQVYGDNAFLNLDIPLYYTNPLASNATFAPYSPQPMYQAGEFFKFVFPVANLDEDKSTVDYSLVSWTRQGPFLPWMAMGNMEGHLIYSSSGARIPSWEYLPEGVKADLENRIPHYKHAPECSPNTTSVTSWTFFGEHYAEWLARERFPLTEAAQYPCFPGTEINPSPSPSPSPSATPSDSPSPSPSPSPSASTTVSSSASRVASLVSFVRGFFQA